MSVGSVSIKSRLAQGSTILDVRMSHPMESGTRTDGMGTVIPAWYLTQMELFLNGKRIATMGLGPLVSKNPAFSFTLKGAVAGDLIRVSWIDNRGLGGVQQAKI